jgi:hypothetical protein
MGIYNTLLSTLFFRTEYHGYRWARLVLVPGGGVEPPRPEGRRILSPLRLPVPPSRLFVEVLDSTANFVLYFVAIPKRQM